MNNKRIFQDVPDCAFHKIVRHYAFFKGRPVLTLRDQEAALMNYITYANRLN